MSGRRYSLNVKDRDSGEVVKLVHHYGGAVPHWVATDESGEARYITDQTLAECFDRMP